MNMFRKKERHNQTSDQTEENKLQKKNKRGRYEKKKQRQSGVKMSKFVVTWEKVLCWKEKEAKGIKIKVI